jgi:BirA family transcriptional regulator, biotin operon repressor / biotin---[acetyl-CoA-carboxylase] ligase
LSSLNPIGKPFIELLTVESTNNYAMGLVRAGMAQHGTVVFTHEQTKGKGQRNKEWISQRGRNIAMSVVIEPGLPASELFLLSMMTAISVCDLFKNYVDQDIKIKWPNDIYWRDRKAAGILIENLWQGSEWKFAVAGIGININQTDFGDLAPRAVSLKEISGKDFEPMVLAKDLCTILEKKYGSLRKSSAEVIDEYKTHLYKRNELVKLKKESRVFEATIKDVDTNGELIVQHAIEDRFGVGEVEWV